ncbi:MAG: BolA family transcriptional regulator [Chromatiaceae bacterium]|nr:BolA family transcriptional regulator [Gammaproteobacteria bacterium]MCB1873005.1 BolA family transcriptional regulator [Gammaproteobacteria bacterium]MCB1880335.1 BolA family transcriptional regulator [Gammaproteobacteria bacterium]MCP5447379.1 BolA family transcriptional regulator [Chromatiaceae bacterium]
MSEREKLITERLTAAFSPVLLELVDESHKHAGHPGARAGGGHFVVTVVSDAFAGKTPLQRHRMVYDALGDLMKTEIHALSISARAPATD